MKPAAEVIDGVLGRDLPLAAAGTGGLGFVGTDIPIEVFCASGRAFGHLPWRATGDTSWADRWLESSFPQWARSILQQWHEGSFDTLEAVVFSRADDASQRLYYYIKDLQRRALLGGPAVSVFDVALLPRETSVRHTADAVAALAASFDIDRKDLEAGIERVNILRRRLADIESLRAADGPLFERLGRAALWSDPIEWLDSLELPAAATGRMRVLLAGSVPPDDRIHRAVEDSGGSIVAETHVHRLTRLGDAPVPLDESPERAIAQQLQRCSAGPRASIDRAQWLLERARAARADAVLLWLTREDEALAWHVPSQRRALQQAGMPGLIVHAARWCPDAETFERLGQFLGSLGHATT